MTEVSKVYVFNFVKSKLDDAVLDELEVTFFGNFRCHFKRVNFDMQTRPSATNSSLEIYGKNLRIMQPRPVTKPISDNLRSIESSVFAHVYLRNPTIYENSVGSAAIANRSDTAASLWPYSTESVFLKLRHELHKTHGFSREEPIVTGDFPNDSIGEDCEAIRMAAPGRSETVTRK